MIPPMKARAPTLYFKGERKHDCILVFLCFEDSSAVGCHICHEQMVFSLLNMFVFLLTNFHICIIHQIICVPATLWTVKNNPVLEFARKWLWSWALLSSEWTFWECWKCIPPLCSSSALPQPGPSILGFLIRINSCYKCLVANLHGDWPRWIRPPCRQRGWDSPRVAE